MISDHHARAAALSSDRSFIVQAPAGSGKTGLLVYRMLKLLTTVEQPQQVLSITFTRKATAEMRERLLELMRMAEKSEVSDDGFEQQGIELARQVLARDEAKAWNLLNAPHQLQILTIDSFCAKLTTSMPWLSRLGDRPRTTDNADSHYAAAVEQLLNELLEPASPVSQALQTVLYELDFNYDKARTLFKSMLAKRDQWLRHLLQNDLTSLRASLETTWQSIVDIELDSLNELLPRDTTASLIALASSASDVLRGESPNAENPYSVFDFAGVEPDTLNLVQWKALVAMLLTADAKSFRKRVDKRQGFLAKTAEKDKITALLGEFDGDVHLLAALQEVNALPEPGYSDQDWEQLVALEAVLKSLAGLLQLRFRSAGECDHSEVTQRANLALQELDNPTDLGLRMDYHLQHILVDEFQDTSNGQIELLKKLTAGWSLEESGEAKTLFLVGDPMQSIYRFREADVSLFLQVADNAATQVFNNIHIEPLSLSENFRSCSTLVDWFNACFKQSFPANDNVLTGAIKYAAATSNKSPFDDGLNYLLAHNVEQEAQLVTQAVKEAITELPNDKAKVAILVRSRTHLNHLLPSLHAAGIAYAGVDIQPLREQQAVIDVLALCQALSREDDRVSWLAVLRGPWCGLSLAETKLIAGRADLTVWQQLNQFDSGAFHADSQVRVSRFMQTMGTAMMQRQQVDLSSLTRWAWRHLGGEHTLFGANKEDVESVFELIADLQRGGDLSSLTDLDKALDGIYAKPKQDDSVKVVVSTMHKSKGLQYDTVILPSLGNKSRVEDKSIMMWAEHQNAAGDSSLLLAPLSLEPRKNDHYSYLRKLDAKRAANETIRLMYVAATRAERKLILISKANADEETGAAKPPASSSMLASVWDALEPKFVFPLQYEDMSDQLENIDQTLGRLLADHTESFPPSIEWQVASQLNTQEELPTEDEASLEFEWATEVATGVGIVLHDWLQHRGSRVLKGEVSPALIKRWRAELIALRVPNQRIDYAVKRLVKAVNNIQGDTQAHFLFAEYPDQHNEYTVSAYEDGSVNKYRLDRTFVDEQGTRWIVDYKSTDTNNQNVEAFVDEQVATRHRAQLDKYGQLLSQIDKRPITLAVYFPLLKQLRTWSYQASDEQ